MEYKLSANKREKRGERVRTNSVLPAVVYGAGKDNISLVLDYNGFVKLHETAGVSSLIDLSIDDKDDSKVLIHNLQYDPVTDRVNHVDLRRIEMGKEMTATIVLNFIGEAPAVKEAGGTLVKNTESLEVKCLPKDLVSEIEVDLSSLKTFDDVLRVKNLSIPSGIEVTSPTPEDVVAKAVPALTEEQLKAMEEASTDVAGVEVSGEKAEEGEADGEEKKGEEPAKTEEKVEEKK